MPAPQNLGRILQKAINKKKLMNAPAESCKKWQRKDIRKNQKASTYAAESWKKQQERKKQQENQKPKNKKRQLKKDKKQKASSRTFSRKILKSKNPI
jgi:hypothetical protein